MEIFKLSENQMLSDVGERGLLKDMIFPLIERSSGLENVLGDDCAIFSSNSLDTSVVWTIDPAPLPIAWLIGDRSYYTYGWYSVAINLSDLAAMGAKPYGILLSIVAPNNMKIYELKEFIQGANDCCRKYDAYIMGGNIKDGNDFSCVVSAIGTSKLKRVMRRKGACEGDFIISVGEFGAF